MTVSLPPVQHSIEVAFPQAAVFRIFTESIDSWWPLATHSVGGDRVTGCFFEGAEGGRIYETTDDGSVHLWGTVTVWEPPHRFVMSWHPGRDSNTAQELELRFSPREQGTLVELEHRGWEPLREKAKTARDSYETGWPGVLTRFVDCCAAESAR